MRDMRLLRIYFEKVAVASVRGHTLAMREGGVLEAAPMAGKWGNGALPEPYICCFWNFELRRFRRKLVLGFTF